MSALGYVHLSDGLLGVLGYALLHRFSVSAVFMNGDF